MWTSLSTSHPQKQLLERVNEHEQTLKSLGDNHHSDIERLEKKINSLKSNTPKQNPINTSSLQMQLQDLQKQVDKLKVFHSTQQKNSSFMPKPTTEAKYSPHTKSQR